MKIAVVGTGYVGLVAGTCFANFGMHVTCLDTNPKIVESLKNGKITIHEPGLEELVIKNIDSGRLSFSTDKKHLDEADVLIIAVGTPEDKAGKANMIYFDSVLDDIIATVKSDKVVFIKSTVPIETAKRTREFFAKEAPNLKFSVVSNPEFLREGSAVFDFNNPDRIVIGHHDEKGVEAAKIVYGALESKGFPIVFVKNETAEFIKYSANSYLAMRIAFINEMADIAEEVGADIDEVAYGMGMDKRIGCHYLKAGPGFGGSCFPKDTKALLNYSENIKRKSLIVEAVIKSNDDRKERMSDKILNALGKDCAGKTVSILGLAFKADTDDLRDSASLVIIPRLLEKGLKLKAYDPSGTKELEGKFGENFVICDSLDEALKDSNAAAIITEWSEFKSMCLESAKRNMKDLLIIDLRNLLNSHEAINKGFKYTGIGKKSA